mmetsp:Transcript_54329/g.90147  ORF Transcript_54329/g.90147 Transcript_54329/m.90147 type:complete len:119 (-) Transcript_54329:327-683(-)
MAELTSLTGPAGPSKRCMLCGSECAPLLCAAACGPPGAHAASLGQSCMGRMVAVATSRLHADELWNLQHVRYGCLCAHWLRAHSTAQYESLPPPIFMISMVKMSTDPGGIFGLGLRSP